MDFDKAYDLVTSKLSIWIKEFIKMLPNLILAAIILVIGFFIAKFLRGFSRKMISKISNHKTLNNLFASIIYITFIGITIFVILSILQLDKAVTSILAGAGIIGLALAFAFQDIAANFISGIFISFRRPISIGDIVKIGDYMGKVKEINLRDTIILTFQGQMVIIPNKNVFQNPIENYSLLGKRRLDLTVGISYDADLENVEKITLDAVKDITGLSDDAITMGYKEFADSSINYVIRLWIQNPEQAEYWRVRHAVIIAIKKAYDTNNISIPFPIRTLDFAGQPIETKVSNQE
ncbi:mechanosensitive ion channel family protein [Flavobacterium ardleyense]|uniref:mechanosensitive ion channel family protein n=1 Tax=Flavobacterium ardleyense TaxID=2038737 RepID=UPI00298CB6B9|nr:mechanosensitive ion channel [Flavobacterium ardleyense]